MKNLIYLSIVFLLGSQLLVAQKPLKFELKSKNNDNIYINLTDKNEIEYVVIKNDLDSKKSVNAKDNSINIYLKWINPLKYKLTWKDSTYTDARDKAITDFINLLVGQFGAPVLELNETPTSKSAETPGKITMRSFTNMNLVVWFLHIMENKTEIEKIPAEADLINSISRKLEELDKLNSNNVSDVATKIYVSLIDIKDINQYNTDYPKQVAIVAKLEGDTTGFKKIESLQKSITDELQKFALSNDLLNTYSKATITNYNETVTTNLNSNKKIVQKLKPVLDIVKASTENESSNPSTKGYYKIRSAEFDDGKELESKLTITEFEFKKKTTEFSKKSDIVDKTFLFQKYDIFDVSVSTGLFFANATLKGFGIANDANNNFIVTEDNINKNTAVTAIFLNFNFKTSRYFSPLFQLGIDPTKKRPFMLAGAGFSIPVARIAFSAGPIWTWEQSLDKLTVGQTITSTTDLDKDIKYKFNFEPRGWYLGIQYNF